MSALLLTLLSLGGCARVAYVSHFTETVSRCDFDPEAAHTPADDAPMYPSEDCVDAVLVDFGADVSAFLEADGLPDPYGLVRGDAASASSRLGLLLRNARALMLHDLGTRSDVPDGALVSDDFIDILDASAQASGHEDVSALLYDFAASVIVSSIPGDRPGSRAALMGDTLVISQGIGDDYVTGTVLVHEARHWWVGHGTCPWNADKSCDPDISGAYGFGLSAKLLTARNASLPGVIAQETDKIDRLMNRIVSFNDANGDRLPEWATFRLEDW